MAYEQKNGQFTVWKNEKYTQGGNQPYAKGKGLDLSGKEIEVTLWIPKSDKIKGFNLTISEPYVKADGLPAPQKVESGIGERPTEEESGLPFN